jgi:hypothetical protein
VRVFVIKPRGKYINTALIELSDKFVGRQISLSPPPPSLYVILPSAFFVIFELSWKFVVIRNTGLTPKKRRPVMQKKTKNLSSNNLLVYI